MKINLPAVFIFLLFSFASKAQMASIIVLNVTGQIEYHKNQAAPSERLLPGMKITRTGTITLKNGASVTLLQNGKTTQFNTDGVYDLKTLSKNDENILKMSFAGRFWNFVNDGLSQSDDKESLNEYSDRVLAVTGGVQGFALDESALKTIMPQRGNIGVDLVTFNWYSLENAFYYRFTIINQSENDEFVFKGITWDTTITLDFKQFVFHSENTYEWRVEMITKDKTTIKSDSKTFEYFSNANEFIIQKAEKIDDYKNADNFEKQWMEAIVMEQENFIYDAYVRYADLWSQNPDNLLVKKLFAAFLVRQNLTSEALRLMD